jgi:hypothetical protein
VKKYFQKIKNKEHETLLKQNMEFVRVRGA